MIDSRPRIVSLRALPRHRLSLIFADGTAGEIDFSADLDRGVFKTLRDETFLAKACIGETGRTVEWPNGIDLCADALYLQITGKKPEELFPRLTELFADA
ncbi:MAG: DUF2442 domain-containing protein [Verrucomicrobiales bacterium]